LNTDFASLILSNPNLSAMGVLSIFVLIFIRIIPIMAMAPFLGAKLIPASIRVGFAIALTFVFAPALVLNATTDVPFNTLFLAFAAKEFLIGFLLGFLATIPFYVAESAGTIIDYQRGSSSMMAQDITTQSQVSSLGILYNRMLLIIFFEFGGTFFFISALLKSYQIVPVDGWIHTTFFNADMPFWQVTLNILNHIMSVGIQLAAPAMIAILMAEAFLGIANRLAPQVQIAFLGLSLKSFVGLLILMLGWFFILKQMGLTSLEWMRNMAELFMNMAPQ